MEICPSSSTPPRIQCPSSPHACLPPSLENRILPDLQEIQMGIGFQHARCNATRWLCRRWWSSQSTASTSSSVMASLLVDVEASVGPEPPEWFSRFTSAEAERPVVGNLCRCTGYCQIADTCKSFAADVDLDDLGLNPWRKGDVDISKLPPYKEGSIGTFPEFLKDEIRAALGIDWCTLAGSGSYWLRPRSVEEYYKLIGCEYHIRI